MMVAHIEWRGFSWADDARGPQASAYMSLAVRFLFSILTAGITLYDLDGALARQCRPEASTVRRCGAPNADAAGYFMPAVEIIRAAFLISRSKARSSSS